MKRFFWLFSVIALILVIGIVSYAHPGKTDANGGHTDNSTGEYHYHHGYPAHQHTGGKCPYDYHNNESSSSSSGSNSSSGGKNYGSSSSENSSNEADNTVLYAILTVVFMLVFVVLFFLSGTKAFENNIIGWVLSLMGLGSIIAVFITFVLQPWLTICIVAIIIGIAYLIHKLYKSALSNIPQEEENKKEG